MAERADPRSEYHTSDLTLMPVSMLWRYIWRANPRHAVPLFAFFGLRKLLGWRFRATYGVPRGTPARIGPDELPDAVRDAMTPSLQACRDAGFQPFFFVKPEHVGWRQGYSVFLLDPQGKTAASIVWLRMRVGSATAERLVFACHSTRDDGGELDTGALPNVDWHPEMIPPERDFFRLPGDTPPAAVIEAHRDRLRNRHDIVRFDCDSLWDHTEQQVQRLFDFMAARGFYIRLSAAEVDRLRALPPL